MTRKAGQKLLDLKTSVYPNGQPSESAGKRKAAGNTESGGGKKLKEEVSDVDLAALVHNGSVSYFVIK